MGEFVRIKRNCSDTSMFHMEGKELYARFRERGYSHTQIKIAKRKVAARSRKSLLLKNMHRSNEGKKGEYGPVRLITTYGSQWDKVRNILAKHWGILTSNKNLAGILGRGPKMLARRAKNLSDILVQSEYIRQSNTSWLTEYPRSLGMFPCTRCQSVLLLTEPVPSWMPPVQKSTRSGIISTARPSRLST